MKLQKCRAHLLIGVLCYGLNAVASGTSFDDDCEGVDSQFECVHVGNMKESRELSGTLACRKSETSPSRENSEYQRDIVAYQFKLTQSRLLRLKLAGLEGIEMMQRGTAVMRAGRSVSSVHGHFGPGSYVLTGRSLPCTSESDTNAKEYEIRIDSEVQGTNKNLAATAEQADSNGPVVASTKEERKPVWRRIAKWALIASLVWLGLALVFVAHITV